MYEEVKDWTHTEVTITDIRKVNDFYLFTVLTADKEELGPLSVKSNIFEDRLKPYFLKDVYKVTREEILGVKWNMYITKGYYIKLHRGKGYPHEVDPTKHYVSYLEIAGPLGSFESITCKEKDHE